MCRSSELVDGLEPHDQFYPVSAAVRCHADRRGREEVYPGWLGWVGTRRVLYRVHPAGSTLRLI